MFELFFSFISPISLNSFIPAVSPCHQLCRHCPHQSWPRSRMPFSISRDIKLTHPSLDKIAAISHNNFTCLFVTQTFLFLLKFHRSLFPMDQLSIGLDNSLVPNRLQTSIWTNADSGNWSIYGALGRDEFSMKLLDTFELNIKIK